MWEIFTCGKMPYGRLKNTEVVERVQRGIILEKPKACFKEVYEVIFLIFQKKLFKVLMNEVSRDQRVRLLWRRHYPDV